MKCAIMQPTYLSWMGYFDLMDSVDKFIFLDDVKLEKCSWQVRNRVKLSSGEIYLTIPIRRTVGRDKLQINTAEINKRENWREKHLKSIFFAYRKAVFFEEVYPFVEKLINIEADKLANLTIKIISVISEKIGLNTKLLRSMELNDLYGGKDIRVVSICKEVDCDEYISPPGAAEYIEKYTPGGEFIKNGIALAYHNYRHPIYTQLYGDFLPFMSTIDLLFNCGFNNCLDIIKSGHRNPIDYLSFRNNLNL